MDIPLSRVPSEAEPRILDAHRDPGLRFAPHPAYGEDSPPPESLALSLFVHPKPSMSAIA